MSWDRRISLFVSAAYIAFAISQDINWPVLLAYLLPVLFLVWFGDAMGDYIGPAGKYGYIDRTSPGILVRLLGWFLLLLPVGVYWYFRA